MDTHPVPLRLWGKASSAPAEHHALLRTDTSSSGHRLQPALAYAPLCDRGLQEWRCHLQQATPISASLLTLGKVQKGDSHLPCFPLYLKKNELKNSRFLEGHKAPLQFTAHIEFPTILEHVLDCSPPEVNQESTVILTNNYKILAKLCVAWEKCTWRPH